MTTAENLSSVSPAIAPTAESWRAGEADLIYAGRGRQVPVRVQLSVLAHARRERLVALGRLARRRSVQRAWGSEMAELAGEIAGLTEDGASLAQLQHDVLVPLELDVWAGDVTLADRSAAARCVRERIVLAR